MSDAEAEIAFLKLAIEKLRRELYGQRSERKERLLDQLEIQLDELEASATEDELATEKAAETTEVTGFRRRRSGRKPFPAHLPRERVVVPLPRRRPHLPHEQRRACRLPDYAAFWSQPLDPPDCRSRFCGIIKAPRGSPARRRTSLSRRRTKPLHRAD